MVEESVIRQMTRLALEYKAVNLSQGFPNEPPPLSIRLALARAVLEGSNCNTASQKDDDDRTAIMDFVSNCQDPTDVNHHVDEWNQYSPPMGRMDLRSAIADHYRRMYDFDVNSHGMDITVTLGATEALATALRSICGSTMNDNHKVIIIEPFHELYPSQCQIFSMEPIFLTLHQLDDGQWKLNENELQNILIKEKNNVKAFVLNSPHNPTGKVFTREELMKIVQLCVQYNVTIITDDIYEHMIYDDDAKHCLLPKEFPEYAHQMLVCNSIGKSASATGWRVGWCLHPKSYTSSYRGIHDQLVVMAPHPMQYATLAYFQLPMEYFTLNLSNKYKSRIRLLITTLKQVGFINVVFPQGAYYIFCQYRCTTNRKGVKQLLEFDKPMEAAMYLIQKCGVACVPGDNFYGKQTSKETNFYLRFAACRSLNDIQNACHRIQQNLTPL